MNSGAVTLTAGQLATVLSALGDAIAFRESGGFCQDCDILLEACADCAEDERLAAAYRALKDDLSGAQTVILRCRGGAVVKGSVHPKAAGIARIRVSVPRAADGRGEILAVRDDGREHQAGTASRTDARPGSARGWRADLWASPRHLPFPCVLAPVAPRAAGVSLTGRGIAR